MLASQVIFTETPVNLQRVSIGTLKQDNFDFDKTMLVLRANENFG